jgi:hypothetical protein
MSHLAQQVEAQPQDATDTLFGPLTMPTEEDRRQAMALHRAQFDPLWAFKTLHPENIQAAAAANPATAQLVKETVSNEIAENGHKMDYYAKERAGRLLAAVGVPLQDPVAGAMIQTQLARTTSANTDNGQKLSARNLDSIRKNNRATLTRAQSLLTLGTKTT